MNIIITFIFGNVLLVFRFSKHKTLAETTSTENSNPKLNL